MGNIDLTLEQVNQEKAKIQKMDLREIYNYHKQNEYCYAIQVLCQDEIIRREAQRKELGLPDPI